ncbi:MAG: hypothetical protein IIA63_05870 [Nitrospinae bacterium]|nr:hypothetical protein [Nitrospinota bacterium]
MDQINSKLLDWSLGKGVGASSECMAAHLTGRQHDKAHPSDVSDFKRCLGLLDAVPELRPRLRKMKEVSKQWAALIINWGTIEKIVLAGEPGAYKFIRSILDPIDDADPNTIRLSGGTIICFRK